MALDGCFLQQTSTVGMKLALIFGQLFRTKNIEIAIEQQILLLIAHNFCQLKKTDWRTKFNFVPMCNKSKLHLGFNGTCSDNVKHFRSVLLITMLCQWSLQLWPSMNSLWWLAKQPQKVEAHGIKPFIIIALRERSSANCHGTGIPCSFIWLL